METMYHFITDTRSIVLQVYGTFIERWCTDKWRHHFVLVSMQKVAIDNEVTSFRETNYQSYWIW